MEKAILAYIPVVHRGYLNYLGSTGAKTIYALQAHDLPQFSQLTREIRALPLDDLSLALRGFGYEVLPYSEYLKREDKENLELYVPEDDVTREMIFEVGKVVVGSAFLRWDWTRSTVAGFVKPEADRVINVRNDENKTIRSHMMDLFQLTKRSSDWWRQVAAMAITEDGKCLRAYNKHHPYVHFRRQIYIS